MANIRIYLDNQASTPTDPAVISAMLPFFHDHPGNPHANDHAFGWEANASIEKARSEIAQIIDCDDTEVIFTSGATESNNLAIFGLAAKAPRGRNRILISSIEHKSLIEAALFSAQTFGLEVDYLQVDRDGFVDLDQAKSLIDETALVVSVMAVNNEVGSIQSISTIAGFCKDSGVILHSDAAQALGAMEVDVQELGVDLLSLSGHKIYGPKGIGILYMSNDLQAGIEPLIRGGGQQNGLRSGTLPVPLCVGLGKAFSINDAAARAKERHSIARLRDRFVSNLQKAAPDTKLIGPQGTSRHPANASVMFPGIDASDLLTRLQPMLAASTGSACTSGIPEPSHVLMALGLTASEARSCVRFSFGRFSTLEDCDAATDLIIKALLR